MLGKTGVRSKDDAGFIVNRLLVPYLYDAVRLLDEGFATREDIDTAIHLGLAPPDGAAHAADLIGLDTMLSIGEVLHAEFGEEPLRRATPAPAHGRRGPPRPQVRRRLLPTCALSADRGSSIRRPGTLLGRCTGSTNPSSTQSDTRYTAGWSGQMPERPALNGADPKIVAPDVAPSARCGRWSAWRPPRIEVEASRRSPARWSTTPGSATDRVPSLATEIVAAADGSTTANAARSSIRVLISARCRCPARCREVERRSTSRRRPPRRRAGSTVAGMRVLVPRCPLPCGTGSRQAKAPCTALPAGAPDVGGARNVGAAAGAT